MVGVVADTGPLNYLILIDEIDLLPRLFGSVAIPEAVCEELLDPRAPISVRAWMTSPPPWLRVAAGSLDSVPALATLDTGERAAIDLAIGLSAGLLVMDDRAGVAAARSLGFRATGTPGVLDLGARLGWINFHDAVTRLMATNFRVSPALLDDLVARHRLSVRDAPETGG